MTTFQTLTSSIINIVIDHLKNEEYDECRKYIDNFIESIKSLKKKQHISYGVFWPAE